MKYTINMQVSITDENGDELLQISRNYEQQPLSNLPAITEHFGKIAALSVDYAHEVVAGEKLGASEG